MTAKRFTIDKKGGVYYLFDNGNLIPIYDGQPICDLLNKLHLRNKKLEEKIQRERISFTKTRERWSKEAETKIKELTEENEQLEKEAEIYNEDAMGYQTLYEQQVEKNKFIIEQIKAFRDDCYTYLDFDGANTLNRLLDILREER